MSAPTYFISQNDKDTHQRNPSWLVFIVRFKEPAAMYAGTPEDIPAEKKAMIIENDCIDVSINRPKNSFGKTAQLTMKIGDVYYQNAVSPGDWVFIWMSDWQDDIDRIATALSNRSSPASAKILNDWRSGLKFSGRVLDLPASDTIAVNGQRTLVQRITCQAFLELSSSIYYTFIAPIAIGDTSANQSDPNVAETVSIAAGRRFVDNGLKGALSNLSDAFLTAYKSQDAWFPDTMVALLMVLTMGIDKDKNIVDTIGLRGTFSDAITVPKSVSQTLNRPKATKLWQLYNVYLGVQKYEASSDGAVWNSFSPLSDENSKKVPDPVFWRSPFRCKGFIPFMYTPEWDNKSLWDILNQFLNPVVNEMYTALRINAAGKIMPSLIVREQPFSTNLFRQVQGVVNSEIKANEKARKSVLDKASQASDAQEHAKEEKSQNEETTPRSEPAAAPTPTATATPDAAPEFKANIKNYAPDLRERTMFGNLPRWVISETMIDGVNTAITERARINFVQVWGRSKGAEFMFPNLDPELYKIQQFLNVNYVADTADIARNGLRASIVETEFDIMFQQDKKNISLANLFSRMRADWLFNGHLKPSGTISCNGISAPICEGDNVQVRGVVYHIDGLAFNGTLGADGKKKFTTQIQVSNGILADSITNVKDTVMPKYPIHQGTGRYSPSDYSGYDMPGVTDIQVTGPKKNRDDNGDPIK